jgi:hypothetical protein
MAEPRATKDSATQDQSERNLGPNLHHVRSCDHVGKIEWRALE